MESFRSDELDDECAENAESHQDTIQNAVNHRCDMGYNLCGVGIPVPDMDVCKESDTPAAETPFAAAEAAASGPTATTLASGCPCPGGVNTKVDGCNITATCGAGLATASIGCPEVRGAATFQRQRSQKA